MLLPPISSIVTYASDGKLEIHNVSGTHRTPLINIMLSIPDLFTTQIFKPSDTVQPIGKTVVRRFHDELEICDFRAVIELHGVYPDFLKSEYASVPVIQRLLKEYLLQFAICYLGPHSSSQEISMGELPDEGYREIKDVVAEAHAAFEECEKEQQSQFHQLITTYRSKLDGCKLSCEHTQNKMSEIQQKLIDASEDEKKDLEKEIDLQKKRIERAKENCEENNIWMRSRNTRKKEINQIHQESFQDESSRLVTIFHRKKDQIIEQFKRKLISIPCSSSPS